MTNAEKELAIENAVRPCFFAFLSYPAKATFKTTIESGQSSGTLVMTNSDHARIMNGPGNLRALLCLNTRSRREIPGADVASQCQRYRQRPHARRKFPLTRRLTRRRSLAHSDTQSCGVLDNPFQPFLVFN